MSDGDLTQFNRVAADAEAENAADALTSQLLLITDGKKITGEANSAGKAPVNRGTKSLANKIAGLRGALFGNVTGIAKRSLKSLLVDGTGGVSHTLAAGMAKCANLFATASCYVLDGSGDQAQLLPASASMSYGSGGSSTLIPSHLRWQGTVAANANPAKTTSYANTLYPLNVAKFWITFSTDGAGNISMDDGAAGCTLSIASAKIVITFPSNFDNVYYAVIGTGGSSGASAAFHADPADKTVSACKVKIGSFDPAATAVYGQLAIFGRQTT